MTASLVITVIGPDRPGLVETLSRTVSEHGGNWTRSRMAHLAGQFAGILHVTVPADAADGLKGALESLSGNGLQVAIAREDVATGSVTSPAAGLGLTLDLVGQDRPGIVNEVTAALSALDANIETFRTWITAEPHSGAPLFNMEAQLRLPRGLLADQVQTALEDISAEIQVDISLTPAE